MHVMQNNVRVTRNYRKKQIKNDTNFPKITEKLYFHNKNTNLKTVTVSGSIALKIKI